MSDECIQNNRIIDKITIFIIGVINTAPYIIGNYVYQNVLIYANYERYYFIFFWINTTIILISRFLNTVLVSFKLRYDICFIVYLILMSIGFLACSFAFNFWTTLVCIASINFSTGLTDSGILCFITHRRKQALLKPWICGLGTAGLISAGYTFLCAKYDVSIFWTMIAFVFIPPLYGLLFFSVLHRSPKSSLSNSIVCENENDSSNHHESNTNINSQTEEDDGLHQRILDDLSENPLERTELDSNNQENNQNIANSTNKKKEKIRFYDVSYFHSSWTLILNCSFVFFIYRAIQGFIQQYALSFEMENVYTIPYMHLCFYIGVFISVCTIFVVQIKQIWIFAIIEILLFTFSICQTFLHFTKILVFYPMMFLFGLCCGFSHANSLYFIMNDETKTFKQRELAVSWNMFFISLFVVISTVLLYAFNLYYTK